MYRGMQSEVLHLFKRCCVVHCLMRQEDISEAINNVQPNLVCFEYDYPDFQGLSDLREAKLNYPSIPILMITDQSSESLAIWAFRTRVWDYFVKPVVEDDLLNSIETLAELFERPSKGTPRRLLAPPVYIPVEARFQGSPSTYRAVHRAVAFVERNLTGKIRQNDIAKMCGMSPYQFSRSFKETYGMRFMDYLTRRRIQRAVRLLHNPDTTITDVCYAVGFNDASYFTRTFRRYTGITPSEFRKFPNDYGKFINP